MANQDQVDLIRQGTSLWNKWRWENPNEPIDLSGANLKGADLVRANLEDANLSGTDLRKASLIVANLNRSILCRADLRGANLGGAKLEEANLSEAFYSELTTWDRGFNPKQVEKLWLIGSGGNLEEANLSNLDLGDADLRGANLKNANLQNTDLLNADLGKASLIGANLSNSNLTQANFYKANLSTANLNEAVLLNANFIDADLSMAELKNSKMIRTVALGANFQRAILSGGCIQDWNINNRTNFEEVVCDFIFLKSIFNDATNEIVPTERRPIDPDKAFVSGEFAALIQKSLDTIDLIFLDNFDWEAFSQSFQKLRSQFNDQEIYIQAIEKKSLAFVIRLETSPDADKSAIETKAKELYGEHLKVLEEQYIEKMDLQDLTLDLVKESLAFERKKNTQLLSIVKTMANRDKVTQNFNAQVGNVAGVNEGIQQAAQHNYASEIKQTPAESAKEIQDLLAQLQEENPTDIQAVVEQKIKSDLTFRQRLRNALKEGGMETLKVLFAPIGIPIEMVRGWIDA
ncbi:pentapeptide repeat-containing protein [Acaryochloris marina]|uniref:Pentapeptide repeat protein n=1 Tax=Acaryochloris marina (strain MBIC 11017) TaxID=329726 RepID=A8ZR02_ACAM1|nr:pentapeptide repeat-containing protein [Acaryochloris marina]ABW33438.1 pentapeptide repeat protein [Acaryochloris marina MBIC11017]